MHGYPWLHAVTPACVKKLFHLTQSRLYIIKWCVYEDMLFIVQFNSWFPVKNSRPILKHCLTSFVYCWILDMHVVFCRHFIQLIDVCNFLVICKSWNVNFQMFLLNQFWIWWTIGHSYTSGIIFNIAFIESASHICYSINSFFRLWYLYGVAILVVPLLKLS